MSERSTGTGDDDLVFGEEAGTWLNDDRLRRRYEAAIKAADLRRLRFHDLRHTFGSLAITRADIVEVQAWMGHADIQTTMRYLHYRDRSDAAGRPRRRLQGGRAASAPSEAVDATRGRPPLPRASDAYAMREK